MYRSADLNTRAHFFDKFLGNFRDEARLLRKAVRAVHPSLLRVRHIKRFAVRA